MRVAYRVGVCFVTSLICYASYRLPICFYYSQNVRFYLSLKYVRKFREGMILAIDVNASDPKLRSGHID